MASPAASADAPSQFVRIVSADKHVFVVDRKVAMVSGLIRTMLESGSFREGKGDIEFPEIPSVILDKVIEYFHYKAKYNNSKVPIPEFHIPPENALEVLRAASYLDC